ncbi:MAG: hypothetical protein M1823_003077 [Watsoniomyces obsoletus]|nr:MAG: hypothetical protein M1823_003077 [Watsoniomyces obsoletus]
MDAGFFNVPAEELLPWASPEFLSPSSPRLLKRQDGPQCRAGESPCDRCSPTVNPATINTLTPSSPATTTACASGDSSCSNTIARAGTTAIAAPTATAANSGGDSNEGLTAGARAGIAVGATMAGLSLISLLIWFIMAQRKRRKQRQLQDPFGPGSPVLTQSGTAGGAGGPNMSQGPSPGVVSPSGEGYFGAQPGPFTGAAGVTVADYNADRPAVPLSPQGPGDIAAPVEIASPESTTGRAELP